MSCDNFRVNLYIFKIGGTEEIYHQKQYFLFLKYHCKKLLIQKSPNKYMHG